MPPRATATATPAVTGPTATVTPGGTATATAHAHASRDGAHRGRDDEAATATATPGATATATPSRIDWEPFEVGSSRGVTLAAQVTMLLRSEREEWIPLRYPALLIAACIQEGDGGAKRPSVEIGWPARIQDGDTVRIELEWDASAAPDETWALGAGPWERSEDVEYVSAPSAMAFMAKMSEHKWLDILMHREVSGRLYRASFRVVGFEAAYQDVARFCES